MGINSHKEEFYEYELNKIETFSKKGYNYSDPKYQEYQNRIAELKFSNSDVTIHLRHEVLTLLDLLTKVSGIPNFLLIVFGFVLARFQRFYSNFEMYRHLNTECQGH